MCECHRRVGEFSLRGFRFVQWFSHGLCWRISASAGGRKNSEDFTVFEGMSIFCCAGALKTSIWGHEYITCRSERMNWWIFTGLGSETAEHTETPSLRTITGSQSPLLVSSVKRPRGVSSHEQNPADAPPSLLFTQTCLSFCSAFHGPISRIAHPGREQSQPSPPSFPLGWNSYK